MKAMVLAAGRGERFQHLGEIMPKPMVRLCGKPILEHVIDQLRVFEIRNIIINLHYLPDLIRDYFGDGRKWGVSIRYSLEPLLLGTAGAVRKVAHEFQETFLVYYGDNLCSCNLKNLMEFHRTRGGIATIVVAGSYDEIPGGVVEFDAEGRLVKFLEKPRRAVNKRWENAGIYILEPGMLERIPTDEPSDFGKDVLPSVLKSGERIYCYKAEGYVRGIDTPERYEMVKREIDEGRLKLG